MKLTENNGLRILTPNSNMFIAKKDRSAVYEGTLYLGKFDSENNYIEISENEKIQIEKEIEEKYKKELSLEE